MENHRKKKRRKLLSLQGIKMNTDLKKMKVGSLEVQTVRKDIKNMHLGVYPPTGRVRIAAPIRTTEDSMRLFIISKIPWIKKQKVKFEKQQRQTKREYISGESHYFLGRRFLLNVIHTKDSPKIEIRKKTHLDLHIRPNTSTKKREELLESFYRGELKRHIPKLLSKWERITGIKVSSVNIKKMKTKWGTSNPKDKRIWVNSELAKNRLRCLDYVILHEIIHLLEKTHNDKFYRLLDLYMPQWQQHRKELNNSVLGYFTWDI
jgi:hypothetical protein